MLGPFLSTASLLEPYREEGLRSKRGILCYKSDTESMWEEEGTNKSQKKKKRGLRFNDLTKQSLGSAC